MWNDTDDKILEILDKLCVKGENFPVDCPICSEKEGHIYMHQPDENNQRGGLWLWCSCCRHFSHSGFRIPSWWKNLKSLDFSRMASQPDYLEENKCLIDDWVNARLSALLGD